MFGRVDFWEDEKKKKKKKGEKIRKENFLEGVWLGEGEGEGKMIVAPGCFLPGLAKTFFLPKMEKKLGRQNLWLLFFFFFFFNSLRLKLLLFFFNNILLDWAFAFCFGLTRHDFIF